MPNSLFSIKKRLVYEASLSSLGEFKEPRLPVRYHIFEPRDAALLSGFRMTEDIARDLANYHDDIYVIGEIEGKVVYHRRISLDTKEISRLIPCCHIPERSSFTYGAVTEPEFRGMGIHEGATSFIAGYLRNREIKTMYRRIDPRDPGGRRALERTGFRLVAVVYHIGILGRELKPWGIRTSGQRPLLEP